MGFEPYMLGGEATTCLASTNQLRFSITEFGRRNDSLAALLRCHEDEELFVGFDDPVNSLLPSLALSFRHDGSIGS